MCSFFADHIRRKRNDCVFPDRLTAFGSYFRSDRLRTQSHTYSVSIGISWVFGKRHETRRFWNSKSTDSSRNYSKPVFGPSCKPRQNYLQQRQSAGTAGETNRPWKSRQRWLSWLSRDAPPYVPMIPMMRSYVTGHASVLKWPYLVYGPSEWLNCSMK